MKSLCEAVEVKVLADGYVSLEGDLSEANAAKFESDVKLLQVAGGGTLTVEMKAFDIHDGVALAIAINAFRRLRSRAAKVIFVGAPQMLGHNLYRVGDLEGAGAIELVDMRLDEPSGF